jgi:hypothetical protein
LCEALTNYLFKNDQVIADAKIKETGEFLAELMDVLERKDIVCILKHSYIKNFLLNLIYLIIIKIIGQYQSRYKSSMQALTITDSSISIFKKSRIRKINLFTFLN